MNLHIGILYDIQILLHPWQVLEIDPFNVKALYRRSQAYKQVSEFEKAEADIKTALTIDPNNR